MGKFIEQVDIDFIRQTYHVGPKSLEDTLISMSKGKYVMCVIALDDLLHSEFDYNDKDHGSIKDFIQYKFGGKVLARTKRLLSIK